MLLLFPDILASWRSDDSLSFLKASYKILFISATISVTLYLVWTENLEIRYDVVK